MADVPFPLSEEEISFKLVDGKTYLHFPLEKAEKIFGLGLNFKTVEQRGRIMRLHVDHYGGRDNGRTHAPVPFYVSSKGYGVFINSPTYIDVWVGTAVRKDSKNPPEVRDRNTDKSWDHTPILITSKFSCQRGHRGIYFWRPDHAECRSALQSF